MKKIAAVLLLLLFTCSSDDDKVLSDENFITSFKLVLNSGSVEGDINQSTGSITFDIIGANLTALNPTIIYSENATITPSSNAQRDFTNPVNYIVTAENGDTKTYTVSVNNRPLGTESKILSFSFNVSGEEYNCVINDDTHIISLEVVELDLEAVTPTIVTSEYANIAPISIFPQNFNNVVSYVVTAENGSTTTYEVHITNRLISTESEILSFSINSEGQTFEGVINELDNTIILNASDADISAITPNITISDYATISPEGSIIQNFNNSVDYVVTAENGAISTYTVISNSPTIDSVNPRFSTSYNYFSGVEIKIYGNYIDPNSPNAEFLLIDGSNEYALENITLLSSSVTSNALEYYLSLTIPENVPSSANYKLVYRNSTKTGAFENLIDVMSNAPNNLSANQTEYNFNDVLIINGTNLVPGLVVPSNGNQYIVEASNNYNIQVNSDGTQLTWTLNYYQHFPSYYGQSPQEKKIYMIGDNRRVGKSITVIFN